MGGVGGFVGGVGGFVGGVGDFVGGVSGFVGLSVTSYHATYVRTRKEACANEVRGINAKGNSLLRRASAGVGHDPKVYWDSGLGVG